MIETSYQDNVTTIKTDKSDMPVVIEIIRSINLDAQDKIVIEIEE